MLLPCSIPDVQSSTELLTGVKREVLAEQSAMAKELGAARRRLWTDVNNIKGAVKDVQNLVGASA